MEKPGLGLDLGFCSAKLQPHCGSYGMAHKIWNSANIHILILSPASHKLNLTTHISAY